MVRRNHLFFRKKSISSILTQVLVGFFSDICTTSFIRLTDYGHQCFCRYRKKYHVSVSEMYCNIDIDYGTARSSGILKAKQKLGVIFNSDKLGGIDFTKILKLTMCSECLGGSPGHHFSKNLVCKVQSKN